MNKKFVLNGAMFMALAVALGAMSSHGLSSLSEQSLYLFRLGVQYQIYHAIGLLAIGLMAAHLSHKALLWASRFMFTGIILFSGGLYFFAITEMTSLKFIIPVGGACLIISWLCIIWAIFAKTNPAQGNDKDE